MKSVMDIVLGEGEVRSTGGLGLVSDVALGYLRRINENVVSPCGEKLWVFSE